MHSETRSQETTSVLVTGATGYVGGHLAPELLQRGLDVRCLVRDPRRARPCRPASRCVQGDVLKRGPLGRRARRRRRRLLPRALDGRGGDGGFAERDRAGGGRPSRRAAARRGRRRIVYLGGLARRRRPSTCAAARRSREILRPRRADDRPRARGDGHRRRQRLLRDAAPPGRAPARDGLPALDRHAHPADRDPRRRRHARGARRPADARRRRSSSAAPTSSPIAR